MPNILENEAFTHRSRAHRAKSRLIPETRTRIVAKTASCTTSGLRRKKSVIIRLWPIGSRGSGEIYRALSLAAERSIVRARSLTTRDTFSNTPMICETVRSASMLERVWGPRKRNPFFRPHVLTRWSPSVTSTPLFRSTGEGCMSYGMPMMPSYQALPHVPSHTHPLHTPSSLVFCDTPVTSARRPSNNPHRPLPTTTTTTTTQPSPQLIEN